MIYVLLTVYTLKGGVIMTRSTLAGESLLECQSYSLLVAKDDIQKNPDWNVRRIQYKCVGIGDRI